MDLPLLVYASERSGDGRYKQAAVRHLEQARKYLIRDDHSSYHTFYFDPDTGRALQGDTHQGCRDDSCWARGQAWAVYGFTLGYGYTGDAAHLETAERCTGYFADHLPEDLICYWDLDFTSVDDDSADGLLLHGVYNRNKGSGVNECCI